MEANDTKLADKFWSKVDWTHNPTGCAWWLAGLNRDGYGKFSLDGRTWLAHRVAWMLEHGPVLDGEHVLHRCNNPSCVNPEHLYLGDHDRNMQDMVDAGRQASGEKNGNSKLTEAQVMEIRASTESQRALGRRYGVRHRAIGLIVTGKTWVQS